MVIYDNLDCRNTHVLPDVQRATGSVKTFFCIHRGNVHVSSRFEFLSQTSSLLDLVLNKNLSLFQLHTANNTTLGMGLNISRPFLLCCVAGSV